MRQGKKYGTHIHPFHCEGSDYISCRKLELGICFFRLVSKKQQLLTKIMIGNRLIFNSGIFARMGIGNILKEAHRLRLLSTTSIQSQCRHKNRARRALMYVPGSDEKKLKKIPSLNSDCVVLDCEDGVAASQKGEARRLIREVLDNSEIDFGRSERTVRVNSVDSGLCLADLEEILSVKNLPSCILIPKLENLDHTKWFVEKTNSILKDRNLKEKLDLIFFVESAMAILNLKEITEGSIKICQKSHFEPAGIVFGSDDYYASIGALRSNDASEIAFARQYVVTVAKAYHLQAVDVVYIDFKDQKGLIKQAMQGAAMGYTGKQVIHPVQVSICHEAFSPSLKQIEWARKLVEEYKKHQESGKGAFVFRECMIDRPVLLQAENILAVAEFLSKPSESDSNEDWKDNSKHTTKK
ncbi:unnamed protein product [Allacma fusca]|uniref:Citramalyl-CoA lyase, mitochondrial n=1 Tax=Allacma fusca TaxID=39272 RepID=A0A8J2NQK5_9HEXA|nr:unnamed protein product [Allacma fusca]